MAYRPYSSIDARIGEGLRRGCAAGGIERTTSCEGMPVLCYECDTCNIYYTAGHAAALSPRGSIDIYRDLYVLQQDMLFMSLLGPTFKQCIQLQNGLHETPPDGAAEKEG